MLIGGKKHRNVLFSFLKRKRFLIRKECIPLKEGISPILENTHTSLLSHLIYIRSWRDDAPMKKIIPRNEKLC